MAEGSGLPTSFLSVVLLPLAGNAVEHITAVMVAMKNKMDLALAIAIGSSIQIAIFVLPTCVIFAWSIGNPFSLHLDDLGVCHACELPAVEPAIVDPAVHLLWRSLYPMLSRLGDLYHQRCCLNVRVSSTGTWLSRGAVKMSSATHVTYSRSCEYVELAAVCHIPEFEICLVNTALHWHKSRVIKSDCFGWRLPDVGPVSLAGMLSACVCSPVPQGMAMS